MWQGRQGETICSRVHFVAGDVPAALPCNKLCRCSCACRPATLLCRRAVPQVFVRAPMALELRVKDTLEPRAAFLRKVLSLPAEALGKLIVRHPQVGGRLGWAGQLQLLKGRPRASMLGAPQSHLSHTMYYPSFCCLPHPPPVSLQVLTCTEDMMQLRVDFLLQQGLSQEEVGRAVLAHPQVRCCCARAGAVAGAGAGVWAALFVLLCCADLGLPAHAPA